VVVSAKAIRLWGRCPSMVTIAGVSSTGFPLAFGSSIGSEVHGVAFEGPAWGVLVGIGSAVHIDRVWVHDTGWVGVQVERGATATVEGSLVENATAIGINAHQTDVNIDTSVIRGTRSEGALGGRGVNAQEDQGESATAAITRSLVEGNGDTGLFAGGSMLTVESSVVRDTADMFQSGGGILVRSSTDSHVRSGLTLRASVVENNLGGGVLVGSSDAAIEATTIRDTLPNDALLFGIGLAVTAIDATAGPADATVSASLVQRSHYCGVSVAGSVLSGDAVAIRDTLPRASDQLGGRGLAAQPNLGIESALTLVDSSVERNYEFGIVVTGTNDIEHTRVEGALARPDGLVGDAVAVWSGEQPGVLSLMRSRIADAARAGITSFSATATLHEVVLDCNAIHLNGTDSGFGPFVFEDQGGNTCGCNAETTPCAVRSEKLEPPSPLDPPGA